MSKKEILDPSELVRSDRRSWRDDELLASGALLDFQKLCDDAFQSMRRKYFRPADLIAEMRYESVGGSRCHIRANPTGAQVSWFGMGFWRPTAANRF
jgi:hypothetical protein